RNNYRVIARLASGRTVAQAREAAAALALRLSAMNASDRVGLTVDSMLDDAVRDVRPALSLLLGAVAFLLLIACVNLSNLFGARAVARTSEFAVRLALGASRSRLVAQAVAEAVPVLVLGGLLGVLIAVASVRAFVATAGIDLPRANNIAVNAPV